MSDDNEIPDYEIPFGKRSCPFLSAASGGKERVACRHKDCELWLDPDRACCLTTAAMGVAIFMSEWMDGHLKVGSGDSNSGGSLSLENN